MKLVGLAGTSAATCSRNVKIVPDVDITAVTDSAPVDAVIVPGGLKGADAMAGVSYPSFSENGYFKGTPCYRNKGDS